MLGWPPVRSCGSPLLASHGTWLVTPRAYWLARSAVSQAASRRELLPRVAVSVYPSFPGVHGASSCVAALRFSVRHQPDGLDRADPACDASPARRFARRTVPLHDALQARSGASHEVWFPSAHAGHAVLARRASSGHPASALGGLVRSEVVEPKRIASPLRFLLAMRPPRETMQAFRASTLCVSAACLTRAPPAAGHSPRDSSAVRRTGPTRPGLSWPGRSFRASSQLRTCRSRPSKAAPVTSGGAHGILTLRSVAPAARVLRALPPHEPTCRFANLHRDNFRRGIRFPVRFDRANRAY